MTLPAPVTYSVPEAAAILGINRNTCYEYAAAGKLPAIKLGKRVLILRAGVERLVADAMGTQEGV
jgi:excisionase family DNA binding protein